LYGVGSAVAVMNPEDRGVLVHVEIHAYGAVGGVLKSVGDQFAGDDLRVVHLRGRGASVERLSYEFAGEALRLFAAPKFQAVVLDVSVAEVVGRHTSGL
jgi:hypothetical protein